MLFLILFFLLISNQCMYRYIKFLPEKKGISSIDKNLLRNRCFRKFLNATKIWILLLNVTQRERRLNIWRRIYPQILGRNTISQRVMGAEEIKDEIIGRGGLEGGEIKVVLVVETDWNRGPWTRQQVDEEYSKSSSDRKTNPAVDWSTVWLHWLVLLM